MPPKVLYYLFCNIRLLVQFRSSFKVINALKTSSTLLLIGDCLQVSLRILIRYACTKLFALRINVFAILCLPIENICKDKNHTNKIFRTFPYEEIGRTISKIY